MPSAAIPLPMRESTRTSWLSMYRFFWRNSEWELFLEPCKGGFAVARTSPQAYSCTHLLMDQPGVYELALVKKGSSQRYKVYVGQTSSMRRRFHQEYRGSAGSHLKSFFEEALQNGCQVWRRCRYMKSAEDAKRKEAQLLKRYDYAWNSRQAGCQPRHVNIVISRSCFSKSVMLVSKPVQPSILLPSPALLTASQHILPESQSKPGSETSPFRVMVSTNQEGLSPGPQSTQSKKSTRSWSEVPSLRFDTI